VQVRARGPRSLARPRAQPYFNTRLFPFLAEVLVAKNLPDERSIFPNLYAISPVTGSKIAIFHEPLTRGILLLLCKVGD